MYTLWIHYCVSTSPLWSKASTHQSSRSPFAVLNPLLVCLDLLDTLLRQPKVFCFPTGKQKPESSRLCSRAHVEEQRKGADDRPRRDPGSLQNPLLGWFLGPIARSGMVRSGFPRTTTIAQTKHAIASVVSLDFGAQRTRTQRISVPMLLAWAEDDAFVESEISQEMAEACPSGPRLAFPTGGHNIQKTRAKEIGATLQEWVSGLTIQG